MGLAMEDLEQKIIIRDGCLGVGDCLRNDVRTALCIEGVASMPMREKLIRWVEEHFGNAVPEYAPSVES
jgi:hypothetical protein